MQPDPSSEDDIKVLVIDDSETTCELVREYLSEQSISRMDFSLSARAAQAALKLAEKNLLEPTYDLIILDIHLPGITGIELCRMIRHHRIYAEVPILIITADQSLELLQKSYEVGATDYILKPFSKVELLVRFNHALNTYKRHLKQLTHVDPLTNLTNRMLFLDRLNSSVERAQREQNKFAVMFIDMNDFKLLNDIHGHEIGDQALVHLANILKQSSRSIDTVGRYGGDEFALLTENINSDDEANIVIERIYKRLNEQLQVAEEEIHLSISIGVAVYPQDGRNTETLLELADKRMYENKQAFKESARFSS